MLTNRRASGAIILPKTRKNEHNSAKMAIGNFRVVVCGLDNYDNPRMFFECLQCGRQILLFGVLHHRYSLVSSYNAVSRLPDIQEFVPGKNKEKLNFCGAEEKHRVIDTCGSFNHEAGFIFAVLETFLF